MNFSPNPPAFDPPRLTLRVGEFTVVNRAATRDPVNAPVEFQLSGVVEVEDPDAGATTVHPLAGQPVTVSFCGAKPTEDGILGWIQYVPNAPEIAATARVATCPRRVGALRATANHAAGPLGGRLDLVLELGPAEAGGPVRRLPVRDAVIRATRRFEIGNAPADRLVPCSNGGDILTPEDAFQV